MFTWFVNIYATWFVNIYGYIVYWAGLLNKAKNDKKQISHIQRQILQKQILQKCYFFYHF